MSNVLCVAGHPRKLDWYRTLLRESGHTVTAVDSIPGALGALQGGNYDLLVTSWIADAETARELIATARASGTLAVMVVSSVVETAFQEAGWDADLYLANPTTAQEFLQLADILASLQDRNPMPKVAAAQAE